jgi:aconitase B
MTEQEWLAHLDAFVAQELTVESVRDVLDALLRRITHLIVDYANHGHDDAQQLAKRLDASRTSIADLRTIVADIHARLAEQEREAGRGR